MKAIRINPADNVAVALVALGKGESYCGVTLTQDIPAGHKFALCDLAAGDNIIKYGFPTGHLTRSATAGSLVDHSCIVTNLSGLSEYTYRPSRAVRSSRPGPPSYYYWGGIPPNPAASSPFQLCCAKSRAGRAAAAAFLAGPLPLEPRAASLPERNCPSRPSRLGVEEFRAETEVFQRAASAAAPSEVSDASDRGAGEAERSRIPLQGSAGRPGVEEFRAETEVFLGFRRKDGQVGVRNYIWIIPTVGCVSGIAETLARRLNDEISSDPGSVDGAVAFPHNYGCSQLGDDHENTRRILSDLVHHPNAGGVLVVGLGCENNQPDSFMELVGTVDSDRVKSMVTQKVQGDEIEYGMTLLRQIFAVCRNDRRTTTPVSELRIGLKCGGSDGLSGITANPLLGVFSDWLCERGGTTVLTEVPEMFGAETLLMDRCVNREVFDKTVAMVNGFKQYFISQGQPVYENPSPGNKAGGISTLEEKSLGCTQKSGSSAVCDVLEYGDRLRGRGLNLLSAPGNDLVASTALAAAGCQIVLFTTGRGTPFGSPVPTVKISTNSALAANKPGWIDFNAGVLAQSETMSEVLPRFCDFVLGVASGDKVRNEFNGWNGMAIFKKGVTL